MAKDRDKKTDETQEETLAPKPSVVTEVLRVTNLSAQAVVALDAEGNGVHLGAKAQTEIPLALYSAHMETLRTQGVLLVEGGN